MNFKGVLYALNESINLPSNALRKYDNKKEVSRFFSLIIII